jgi:hypothetical protein
MMVDLKAIAAELVIRGKSSNVDQPPRKNTEVMKHKANILPYYARKNKANAIELYSIL